MAELRDFTPIDGLNTGNPSDGRFPEDMSYANVNNAAREMQAIIGREYFNRNGSLVGTGDGDAITVTPNLKSSTTYTTGTEGDRFALRVPAAVNAGATLTIGSVSGPIRDRKGATIGANAFPADVVIDVVFRNAGWQCLGVENPATVVGFDPNTIGGVTDNNVVSVRSDQDNTTHKKIWVGTTPQYNAETKVPNTIYVKDSTDLLERQDFGFDPNTIGGVDNNQVEQIRESRAGTFLGMWRGTKAQYDALATKTAGVLYIYPEE